MRFLGDLFEVKRGDPDHGTKVLVCAMRQEFASDMKADSAAYANHYRNIRTEVLQSYEDLCNALQYTDVVHLFVDVNDRGELLCAAGSQSGMRLIEACRLARVKLLIIASPNEAAAYLTWSKPPGLGLNLILTLDRKGRLFTEFLDRLLEQLAGGAYLLSAWTRLAPQTLGPWHDKLPSCYVAAGLQGALFLK